MAVDSSTEQDKALVRRFTEMVNRGDADALDEVVASDLVDHAAFPGQAGGLEGYKQSLAMSRVAFPDGWITIEDMIAEGDKVVTRYTSRGTHQGEFLSMPPTGKTVAFTGVVIHRIAGGKIAEEWGTWDQLGLMQQLGAIPVPRASG
jgi:steroid delta-isomerase-like uncharacterized protein